ncbi:MAG: molybdopterin-dependent oxidoreductase [Deltaproteobacteria bacterium]|nr:molybdopterin-dependent oxidoreductase [Deltaproteobacteria bacterium]
MDLNRRNFIKLGAAAGAVIAVESKLGLFANAADLELGGRGTAVNPDKISGTAWDKVVPYTCLVCNIEDGGLAFIKNGRVKKLEGNDKHVSTRGRLCAKGNAGMWHIYDPDRILYPLRRTGPRGSGKWKRVSWDEALSEVAARINDVLAKGHPNEIMIKWGRERSGGASTRFMSTLGSNTIVNHTSICESSKKIGMQPTWGPDIETPDFSKTKYILNFGSNILEAAYFMNPYSQRVAEGLVDNEAKLVTFDVRLSNTAGRSHEWFPLFPGTDGIVALAMANVIMQENLADTDFIDTWTNYPSDKLKEYLKQFTPEMAEKYSGVPAKDIRRVAIEFAITKPATTYTYRGPAKHLYGSYNERCTMLLPIITGNIDTPGGYCLPRGMGYDQPQPKPPGGKEPSYLSTPPDYPLAEHKVSQLTPFWIKEGKQKISLYFNYMSCEAFTNPAATFWQEVLMDEKLIPFSVTFSNQMNETTNIMDLVLPDVSYLERHDPESMPSSLWPWVGIRQPVVKPLGENVEYREILKNIIHKVDPDGSKGMKKYWEFKDGEDYLRQQFDNIPGLKEVGGYDFLKENGVWPIYGKLDPATGRIVDKSGVEIVAEYGLYKKEDPNGKVKINGKTYKGFGTHDGKINIHVEEYEKYGFNPLPTFKPHPWHWKEDGSSKLGGPEDMILTTFKWNVHTQSRTGNIKLLSEIVHSNHAWINRAAADKIGVKNGDLIRITSPVGYIVTKARVTEGINPRVIAVSNSLGTKFGRVATVDKKSGPSMWGSVEDPDMKNIWWTTEGVNPNTIIPVSADPIGGSQGWYDTVVKVSPAKAGDKFGDTKVDNAKHMAFFKETVEYAYTGKMHRKMHPEVKVEKLPEPELKKGH